MRTPESISPLLQCWRSQLRHDGKALQSRQCVPFGRRAHSSASISYDSPRYSLHENILYVAPDPSFKKRVETRFRMQALRYGCGTYSIFRCICDLQILQCMLACSMMAYDSYSESRQSDHPPAGKLEGNQKAEILLYPVALIAGITH